jgi:hypothetical protein
MQVITKDKIMNHGFDYETVNKTLPRGEEIIVLVTYELEGHALSKPCQLQRILLGETGFNQKSIFEVNIAISDFTVSKQGTIWAIDMWGNMYCSKQGLENTLSEPDINPKIYELDWSYQEITSQVPLCIAGDDDDLWIATDEGCLIHYNGLTFNNYTGVENPIRIKKVNGRFFLLGHDREVLSLVDGQWVSLSFADDVPDNTPINDITFLNGKLIFVSAIGMILECQDDQPIEVLHKENSQSFFGCDVIDNVLYIAAGDKGAFRYIGGKLEQIKDGYIFMSANEINNEMIFCPAATKEATFGRYLPKEDKWLFVPC